MRRRIIVCSVIYNTANQLLLCRMPKDRGVFPGQWGLPGGGLEENEQINEALKRELHEELGEQIIIQEIQPVTFRDDIKEKTYPDGRKEEIYMIYLIYKTILDNHMAIELNAEFDEFIWIEKEDLHKYELNSATIVTFKYIGLLDADFDSKANTDHANFFKPKDSPQTEKATDKSTLQY